MNFDLSKIFQKHTKDKTNDETDVKSLGGTGFIPALGNQPGIPELPPIEKPKNLPRIEPPSLEAAQAAKTILSPNSKKT